MSKKFRLTKKNIAVFQKKILDWFEINKRDFPWRRTRDPYKILISEVMLQQTQVSRVIPKYKAWLEKFPTVQILAKASNREVLLLWSGLGYNRRALYLKKCAQELLHHCQNDKIIWPQTEKELTQLPGIGKYTARALLCFAFDKQVAVVDTNVRKVILIEFLRGPVRPFLPASARSGASRNDLRAVGNSSRSATPLQLEIEKLTTSNAFIQSVADQLLPKGKAYEWNQALMDYASQMLKKEKILIKKQSPFKDSDRYYRGAIVRLLLQYKRLSEDQIFAYLEKKVSKDHLRDILKKLQSDVIITQSRGTYTFTNP